MDDSFAIKVHAAAVAAWWTVLFAAAFLSLQWTAYLWITATQPGWVVPLWGAGATWESIRAVWGQALLVAKLMLWPIALAALWLTLWARQLRRRAPGA